MKNMKLSFVLCFLLLGQAVGAEPNESYLGLFGPQNFEIGPEIFHQRYAEPGLMKDKGMMYGLYWSYTDRRWLAPPSQGDEYEAPVKKPAQWMVGIDGSVAYGQVDYDGALMDGTPYKIENIDNWLFEARLLTGPDFPKETRIDTIYSGLGFRYLNNDSSSDPAGYARESRYWYMPVGITTLGKLGDCGWSVGGTAEFDILLYGEQTSHLHDLGGDVDNRQHEGYGARGSIRFCKKGPKSNFIIEPFVRYWQIQTSEESMGFVEPKNETTEIGVRFLWRF